MVLKDHIPTKQGLRLNSEVADDVVVGLKDHIPTKQGLRPNSMSVRFPRQNLKDHIPTKQGLRQPADASGLCFTFATRPYPNKTRMKKCPVDISTVRLSESAEQNTFDFLSTYPNKTRMKKKSAF